MRIFENSGKMAIPQHHESTPATIQAVHVVFEPISMLYCPDGHRLILPDNPLFDGARGIRFLCRGIEYSQIVMASPFLGRTQKQMLYPFFEGEPIEFCCSDCGVPLPTMAPHDCQDDARYVAAFLTETCDVVHSIGMCTTWGCQENVLRSYGEIVTEIRLGSIIPEG